jgi:ATP-dependent Lon protease
MASTPTRWSELKEYNEIVSCDIPKELPLLPLISTAVFPHAVVSLQVRLARSLKLLEEKGLENQILATAITKKGITVVNSIDDIHRIGVAVRLISKVKLPNNTVQLVLQGIRRIEVERLLQLDPYIEAHVECLPEPPGVDDATLAVKLASALALFEQLSEFDNRYPPEMVQIMKVNSEDYGRFVDLLASYLNFGLGEKQYLVAAVDLSERYDRLIRLMTAELQKLQVSAEVVRQVQVDVDKSQRQFYLRQQLDAIKKALGEGEGVGEELQEVRKKLAEADLPEGARSAADRELERVSNMSAMSAEYNVVRTYLDWIVDLPWKKSSTDNVDIKQAREILEADHYGLEKVKERILEFLATRHRKENPHGPILCFAGPPGVGKTSLGRSIARALGRKFVRISVGGMHDEAEIRGHRRTYVGALPGKIIQEIRNCGFNNPLFMIDEIDKMGSDFRGDPSSAMLEVLDPEQNFTFHDLYLDLPFDLSKVFFIATANMLDMIPPPLRDRMEVITISGYTPMEKVKIAQKYLIARQIEATGLRDGEIEFTEEALSEIVSSYTYEAGVRNLERNISSICRKVIVRILDGRIKGEKIDKAKVEELLGPPMVIQEVASRSPEVGMVTGLAWTPAGGDLLFIETTKMRGSGKVMVTGQLGSVMEESVEAAYSYVRSKADILGIDPEVFETVDVHIHFPEGAIPKDGPSAGVAVTVALISLFTGLPVYPDIAMTGEVTLKGRVLPIGGLKEKSLAAYRGGIKRVAFPEGNIKDLTEIPPEVKAGLEFIPIKTVDEVLQHALAHIILPSSDVIDEIQHLTDGQTG